MTVEGRVAARQGFILSALQRPARRQRGRRALHDAIYLREVQRRRFVVLPLLLVLVGVDPGLADERRGDGGLGLLQQDGPAEGLGQRRVEGGQELRRGEERRARRQRGHVERLGPRRGRERVGHFQIRVELGLEGVAEPRAARDDNHARRRLARAHRAVVGFDNDAVGDQGLARATAPIQHERPRILEEARDRLLLGPVEFKRLTRRATEHLYRREARRESIPLRDTGLGVRIGHDVAAPERRLAGPRE
mmetsp:Transcript_17733/g.50657  ORF Transcript_17733/g.50657 Transcript_17733/m.50657 type:complete len:249 (-) Transcript_17733:1523-2269(-)